MSEAGGGVIRELLAVFGFGVDSSELKKGENDLEAFYGKVKKIAGGIAGLFAVHEVVAFANEQAELLTHLEHTSAALGISTDKVQELRFASQAMGSDADNLLKLTGRMQVAQIAAAKGSGAQAEAFRAIGVSTRDTNGHLKQADELLLDVADGVSKIKDPAKAAAVATELFGRGGRTLLPFLKKGREGFAELAAEYKKLGGGVPKAAIEAAEEYHKKQAGLTLSTGKLASVVDVWLLPKLAKLMGWVAQGVSWFAKAAAKSNILSAALTVLGAAAGVFAVKMAIANAPLLAIVAAITAVMLIVDDLITMFEGGQSVIGDAIDAMFGKGASTTVVEALKAAWEAVGHAIETAYNWYKKWAEDNALVNFLDKYVYKPHAEAMGEANAQFENPANESSPGWKRQRYGAAHAAAFNTLAPPAMGLPSATTGTGAWLMSPSFTKAQGPQAPGGGGATVTIGEIHVHGNKHMDETAFAKKTGEQIDAHLRGRYRAAHATRPTKPK